MRKIILLIFTLMLFAPFSSAIDKKELNLEFFSRFNDEYLVKYVNDAIDNNRDGKAAGAKVEQYRQQARISLGKELPSLSVGANYLGLHIPSLDNFTLEDNAFVVPFIANYEADIFLKNRDKTKSAKKSTEIAELDEKAKYISLITDTATVYTNIIEYDKLVSLAEENVKNHSEIYAAEKRKFERGVINNTVLNNSNENFKSAQNSLVNLKKQRETLLMQLAVLTGISPECRDELGRGNFDELEYQKEIPEEISSDVIFSRPDVAAAEKRLEKSNIDIRVARKEFLPSFNIVGILGFNTLVGGNFFAWDSTLAYLLAGATQDIFKGGQKIAKLKLEKAKYEEFFENYKQADLIALKEVNTALYYMKSDKEAEKNSTVKADSANKTKKDAYKKLQRGVISTPEYLKTVNSYLAAENEAVQAKSKRINDCFNLYKATGGKL